MVDYHLGHRGLPFGAAAVLLGTVRAPSFALFPVVILLFPDGRLPRRWRWVLGPMPCYAGLVLLATQVLAIKSPAAVAGSTLAAAALFSPLRSRVQRAVDRRFNRARYDADQMVTAFAARLKNAVDLDSVRDDLAGVVHQTLEPAHLSVWVSQHNFPERRAKRLPKVPGGC